MSSPRTVVFCGTPDFAVPSLRALLDDPAFRVELVITQPDKPVGRKQVLTAPPVKRLAEERGVRVAQPVKLNAELERLQASLSTQPDFLVVVAYGQILSDAVLAWPSVAPINVHGSLLPRWRGASPVEHAVLAGDAETGVTIQIMAKELDAGDVLAMERMTIGAEETALQLRARMADVGARLLTATLKQPLRPTSQPTEGITICRKLSREDGKVDASAMTAEEIHRRVRALVPWPGVTCMLDGEEMKILETSLDPSTESMPLPCRDETVLHVRRLQAPSKSPVTGAEWMRGHRKA